MLRKIKRAALTAACAVASLPAFAEGTGTTMTVDTTAAGNAADAIGSAISELISGKITTNVLLVVGAGLVIFAVFLAVRWCLRGGKTASK